jgi:hypothetical protein
VTTEREQSRLVATKEDLERAVVAASHERDQLLVALQPQQRGSGDERRAPGGGSK